MGTITVNLDRTLLSSGVAFYKNDHNIEKITFTMPRFWGDDDLIDDMIRIVYQRADGYTDYYTPDDVAVDESDDSLLHFTWLVSQNVTQVKGSLLISVCAKEGEDDDMVYHWSSKTARTTVRDTLNCGDVLENLISDAVKTELEDLQSLIDTINGEVV